MRVCVYVCAYVYVCVCMCGVCMRACVFSVREFIHVLHSVIKMKMLTSCIYGGFHSKWCPSNYSQMQVTHFQNLYRATASTSPNNVTEYFHKGKEHGVQWQLNRSYCLTCTPGHVAAQFNRHGNCTTTTVDTVVVGKFQAACVSRMTTSFLLMNETDYNGECCRCFMASDIKCSCSLSKTSTVFLCRACEVKLLGAVPARHIMGHSSAQLYTCIIAVRVD